MNSNFSRNPVLLIHGIFRKSGIFYKMSAYLRDLGWSVYTLDLAPHWGNASLEELAQQMVDYIDKNFAPEQPLDLVQIRRRLKPRLHKRSPPPRTEEKNVIPI